VSTEWIALVWVITYVAIITVGLLSKKEFTYRYQIDSQTIFARAANTVPHEKIYIRKTNLAKTFEIRKCNEENF